MPAPSDIAQWREALAWFRGRLDLSDEQVSAIEADVGARSALIAAVGQLDLAQSLWDSIETAQKAGVPFEEAKQALKDRLKNEFGKSDRGDGYRLDAIARTNTQRRYAAGRFAQMTEPDILELRPFWKYSAILDARTSNICRPLNGLVLPADDPFWRSHYPPLHWQCRSAVISLTDEAAQKHGVATHAPKVDVMDGFGDPTAEWEPDVSAKYARPLAALYSSKTFVREPKEARPPPEPKPPPVEKPAEPKAKPEPKPVKPPKEPPAPEVEKPAEPTKVQGTAAAMVAKQYPLVAELLGATLRVDLTPGVEGEGSLAAHLEMFARLPPLLLQRLGQFVKLIHIGPGSVADLGTPDVLTGSEQVGGHGGTRTWGETAGVYVRHLKEVRAGTLGHGSASLMLHEIGHAVDDLVLDTGSGRASAQPEFHAAWSAWRSRLSPTDLKRVDYLSHPTKGPVEAFAEAFAYYFRYGGREEVARQFSPEMADYMDSKLKASRWKLPKQRK